MPQPAEHLDVCIDLRTGAAGGLRRTYLRATVGMSVCDPVDDWTPAWEEMVGHPLWSLVDYAGDHVVMFTDPGMTADHPCDSPLTPATPRGVALGLN